jgi:hypothetical protein
MKRRALAAIVVTLLGTGCGNSDQTTTSPSPTSPVTESFSSTLTPLGVTSHGVTAAQSGTITITLTNASPPATIVLGLGIGIPRDTGFGCLLTTQVSTAAGSAPQLSIPVDTGSYCVSVFDVGNLTTQTVGFTMTIVRP